MGSQKLIEIYQAQDGTTQVEVRFENDTVWLLLQQMADLFDRDKSVIARYLRNICASGEFEQNLTVAKNATVQKEGEREVTREIDYYNLDAMTEQYVLQQLIATQENPVFYWATKKGTTEVDFVLQRKQVVIPIEVKAEENLKVKRLKVYVDQF